MLATASVHELLEKSKTNEILCGRLFSTNNNVAFVDNESIHTVTVVDDTVDNKPIAFGAFQLCSKNQAYFILHECDFNYTNKNVAVKKLKLNSETESTTESHCYLKIVEVANPDVDFKFLPQYYGAFGERTHQPALAHVYDALAEMTFKTYNMDVTKNITIDLYNFEGLSDDGKIEVRDRLGFLVSNDYCIYEVTANNSILQTLLDSKSEEENSISYEEVTEENEVYLLDYDSTTSFFNRENYMEFLLKIKEIKGVIAFEAGQPVGYVLSLNNRILQCYAENEFIAKSLLREVLVKMSAETVKMFIKNDITWFSTNILATVTDVRKIERYHSRVVPSQIKWDNIFILNVGLYLY